MDIHLRTAYSFRDLMHLPQLEEWLDSHRYFAKTCPSQVKEMVQIGALCYSHISMHRVELKESILSHPSWTPADPSNPPIFDLYLSDVISNNKKTKMLFVLAEKSKQEEVTTIFIRLYDGSPKEYPNGSTMPFIPLHEGTHTALEYREKILYNHDKFHGDKAVICIGGLVDLNTKVTLKNNSKVTLRTLFKGFPSSPGMSRPFLFQHIESNSSGMVIMARYQKDHHELVK